MSKVFISLGGWCGPSLALGKMELRKKAYPFDFSRVTFDGIIHFIQNGFREGFFPAQKPPFRPECVGQWILFRSQHCAFAHFNLNDQKVQESFIRKISRFHELFESDEEVIFLRTITAKNPQEELDLIPAFLQVVQDKSPKLKYRLVMMAHDQYVETTRCLGHIVREKVSLWNIKYNRADSTESTSLFDMTFEGYKSIIETSELNSHWNSLEFINPLKTTALAWKKHNNLALIDGEAMVKGTCSGFGSTTCHDEKTCVYCDTRDGHKVIRCPARRPFTKEEDDVVLTHTYTILLGQDVVGVVEDIANQLRREAHEIIERIYHLTNSKKLLSSLSVNFLEK